MSFTCVQILFSIKIKKKSKKTKYLSSTSLIVFYHVGNPIGEKWLEWFPFSKGPDQIIELDKYLFYYGWLR